MIDLHEVMKNAGNEATREKALEAIAVEVQRLGRLDEIILEELYGQVGLECLPPDLETMAPDFWRRFEKARKAATRENNNAAVAPRIVRDAATGEPIVTERGSHWAADGERIHGEATLTEGGTPLEPGDIDPSKVKVALIRADGTREEVESEFGTIEDYDLASDLDMPIQVKITGKDPEED